MKPITLIQRLRNRSQRLRSPLALLYLLLGMAAAWHAPHDIGPRQTTVVHSATSHASVDVDAFCALCSWQSLHQQQTYGSTAAVLSVPLAMLSAPLALDAPTPGFSQAH